VDDGRIQWRNRNVAQEGNECLDDDECGQNAKNGDAVRFIFLCIHEGSTSFVFAFRQAPIYRYSTKLFQKKIAAAEVLLL
jgi:hypothetical protein